MEDVREGQETRIHNGTLFVNLRELRELLLKDDRFADIELEVVHPGGCKRD